MDEPIIVKYRFTEREYKTVMWRLMGLRPWVVLALIAALIGFNVILAVSPSASESDWTKRLPSTGLGTVVLISGLSPWLLSRRNFRSHPDKDCELDWRIDREGVSVDVDSISHTDIRWEDIFRVQEARDGFLLYLEKRSAHWLPFGGFRRSRDVARFRQLVSEKGIRLRGKASQKQRFH